MAYARPPLTQLRNEARTDLASLVGALLRFSNLGITADILSGQTNGLYGYLDYIALQATPFTATAPEIIAGWAALKNVYQKPAQAAALQATFNGSAGSLIPAGTPVTRLSDGATFTTTSDASVQTASGVATPAIVATSVGAAGNTAPGSAMVLGVAVSGVQSQGAAARAVAVGADLEDPASFRTRMLQAYAQPPQGGSTADFVSWAEAIAGVTRAWVAPQGMGPGTVVVYFMMDGAEAAYGGFPQGGNGVSIGEIRDVAASGDQLVVANALFLECNVNALVYACAPAQNVVSLTIGGLSGASAAVKAAVDAAIAKVFLANGSPGGVRLADGTIGGVIDLSDIGAAIASVAGTAGYVITAATASAGTAGPTANVTSNAGALPVLGVVAFP